MTRSTDCAWPMARSTSVLLWAPALALALVSVGLAASIDGARPMGQVKSLIGLVAQRLMQVSSAQLGPLECSATQSMDDQASAPKRAEGSAQLLQQAPEACVL